MISFQNDGLIDLRSISTFGVSVKDSENAIGYFGTGLKYAIAIILRHGGTITVYRGLEKYFFKVQNDEIRGKVFSIVTMNDKPLGFTTEVGKNWELWMAYRELFCNTKDEKGITKKGELEPSENKTTIHIECSDIEKIFNEHSLYFFPDRPDDVIDGLEIIRKPSNIIYYKGVRIGKFSKIGMFTYNILNQLSLTEDRTNLFSWEPLFNIRSALAHCDNADIIKKVLTVGDCLESSLEYNDLGSSFINVMKSLNYKNIRNEYAIRAYKSTTLEKFGPKVIKPNKLESIQLKKAIAFCEMLGFSVDDYVINITDDLPENILGCVYSDEIYIARRAFMMGTKMLASTILEEYLHKDKGLKDESRPMQNYLFDLVITLGEQINGEPI